MEWNVIMACLDHKKHDHVPLGKHQHKKQENAALTFNQLSPLRPLPQSLLQIVRRTLPLQLQLSSLQSRRSVCVEQNVAVLEVLLVRAGLQVLLQTVAAVGGGDGRDVDAFGEGGRGDGRGALGHGCYYGAVFKGFVLCSWEELGVCGS